MFSPTISAPHQSTSILGDASTGLVNDHLPELEERSERNGAARGVLTGVLLGATLWGGILILTGVVKL